MKRFLLALPLLLGVTLSGCAQPPCTPSAAYTVPAHWVPGHHDYETGWYVGKDGAYHYGQHWAYIPPAYVPTQYVPAVTCGKGQK